MSHVTLDAVTQGATLQVAQPFMHVHVNVELLAEFGSFANSPGKTGFALAHGRTQVQGGLAVFHNGQIIRNSPTQGLILSNV